jgi:hypothetical protein
MRLIALDETGQFSLTKNFIDNIPPYAILSHTWGDDEDEVTFNNFMDGSGRLKTGYRKIQLCGEQAARDDLRHFWIDICCIIQTHHRRQRPTKGVAYAAENGGRTYIAFQYERINIFLPSVFPSENP